MSPISFSLSLCLSLLSTSEIFCLTLRPPANGAVNVSDVAVGSTAEYSCDGGFRLLGLKQRNCLQNGTWTGTEPTCMRECNRFERCVGNFPGSGDWRHNVPCLYSDFHYGTLQQETINFNIIYYCVCSSVVKYLL